MISYQEFVAIRESSVEARELYLFITNDGDIYRQRITPIIKNMRRKHKKGEYDQEKALKGWMYAVEDGAKKYHKDFGSGGTWNAMFPKSVRMEVAKELEEYYMEEVMEESVETPEVNASDSVEVNEDVMGMVANGSMDILFKSPEFKALNRKDFFFSVYKGKPYFAKRVNSKDAVSDVEIPVITKEADIDEVIDAESRKEMAQKLANITPDAIDVDTEIKEKAETPKGSLIKPEILKYAKDGNLEKVKKAIEDGANPNVSDEFGNTAMDFARVRNHDEVFDYLKANGGKSKFDK